jgi:hypothetical protein
VLEQTGGVEPTTTTYTTETEQGKKLLTEGFQSLFAERLANAKAQMVVSSSHATQFNLEMPFSLGLIFPSENRFYQLKKTQMRDFFGPLSAALRGNATGLAKLLGKLEEDGALGKTILYSLNPSDNAAIGTIMGAFQTDSPIPGRLQQGSAWWFNDHKPGMEAQMVSLMSLGAFGTFNGMLTDSRSFLSYTRHEYFRRILCNLVGQLVENGEYPADWTRLGQLIENVSYYNTLRYFRFDELLK